MHAPAYAYYYYYYYYSPNLPPPQFVQSAPHHPVTTPSTLLSPSLQYHINYTAVDCNDLAFPPTLRCCQLYRNSEELRSRTNRLHGNGEALRRSRSKGWTAPTPPVNTHPHLRSVNTQTWWHSSLFTNDTLPARIHKFTQTMILVPPAGTCKYCWCQWVFTIARSFFRLPPLRLPYAGVKVCLSVCLSVYRLSLSPKRIVTDVSGSGSIVGSGTSYWRPVSTAVYGLIIIWPLKARIKFHLLFVGIIRSSPFSPR